MIRPCSRAARRCSRIAARAAIRARSRRCRVTRISRDCTGPDYLRCWNAYWAYTKTDDFRGQMRAIVAKPDFPKGNYLSTDLRVPVTLLQTYTCSPLASNAIAGNIWDNFSSQSYKELPSVGTVTVHDPFTGEPRNFNLPADGRGYTRPASLISLWSTAPFLLITASDHSRRELR